ncbi:MAG: hypothetical protein MUC60_01165 [Oscillatoria sp. Prado101]|nr:hypothetical protein [Oscillatoria sp. Prado101]
MVKEVKAKERRGISPTANFWALAQLRTWRAEAQLRTWRALAQLRTFGH